MEERHTVSKVRERTSTGREEADEFAFMVDTLNRDRAFGSAPSVVPEEKRPEVFTHSARRALALLRNEVCESTYRGGRRPDRGSVGNALKGCAAHARQVAARLDEAARLWADEANRAEMADDIDWMDSILGDAFMLAELVEKAEEQMVLTALDDWEIRRNKWLEESEQIRRELHNDPARAASLRSVGQPC